MLSSQSFRTHHGETIKGKRLTAAWNAVADDWIALAHAIFNENAYAAHVTQDDKLRYLKDDLQKAEMIRSGREPMGFWLWQRLNAKLTGECIALLPK